MRTERKSRRKFGVKMNTNPFEDTTLWRDGSEMPQEAVDHIIRSIRLTFYTYTALILLPTILVTCVAVYGYMKKGYGTVKPFLSKIRDRFIREKYEEYRQNPYAFSIAEPGKMIVLPLTRAEALTLEELVANALCGYQDKSTEDTLMDLEIKFAGLHSESATEGMRL